MNYNRLESSIDRWRIKGSAQNKLMFAHFIWCFLFQPFLFKLSCILPTRIGTTWWSQLKRNNYGFVSVCSPKKWLRLLYTRYHNAFKKLRIILSEQEQIQINIMKLSKKFFFDYKLYIYLVDIKQMRQSFLRNFLNY